MAGRAVGGAAGAGCGAFSLLGLLVGIGLTVWLASQVTGGISRTQDRGPGTLPDIASISDASGEATFAGATLALDPPEGLDDHDTVQVTGTGFPPGRVEVTSCLTHGTRSADGTATCDASSTATATATAAPDGTATFTLAYRARRLITVSGVRFDCASIAAGCSLVAHPAGQFDAGPTATLTFATGLPPAGAKTPPSS